MNDFLKKITDKFNEITGKFDEITDRFNEFTSKSTEITTNNSSIVYCTKCGKSSQKTSSFCTYCGSKLFIPETSQPAHTIPIPVPIKETITSEELNYQATLERYLTTRHISAPSKYTYRSYFEAEFNCILNGIPAHAINVSNEKRNRNKQIMLSPNYLALRSNTNICKLKDFVSIDVETTGLSTGGGDIIEVSAIKWNDFEPVSIFSTYCKPRKPIPYEATMVNHITDEMVANAPTFKEIAGDLEKFIGGLPLVAHNAPFDLKFLYVCGMASIESCDAYDTLSLSRSIVRDCDGEKLENYKLETVCNEICIYFDHAHDSATDCLAAGLLFVELIKIKKSTDNILRLMY